MNVNIRLRLKAGLAMAVIAAVTACGGGGGDSGDTPAPSGTVTTLAGSAGQAGSADGSAAQARFNAPEGIAATAAGVVYVADTGNQTIRRIAADGAVTTLAGSAGSAGTADGAGAIARFSSPRGLALDAAGNLFVADSAAVRRVTPAGTVTTVTVPGTGTVADVAVDAGGNLYVARGALYRVTPGGQTTTFAPLPPANGDGSQPVFVAVAVDAAGNVHVAQRSLATSFGPRPGAVRKLNAQGTELASADVVFPAGLAVGDSGRMLVGCGGSIGNAFPTGSTRRCSGVLQLDGNYALTLVAGVGEVLSAPPLSPVDPRGNVDGLGQAARFSSPQDVATSASGIYVADTGNHTVRRIQP